ncbi:MAG TPA: hypothetical protein VEL75_16940, partial [Candidatus Methylomirabilis sp.]|nr:hypothetical protein [Candidatus Methylomirabilis sp.]
PEEMRTALPRLRAAADAARRPIETIDLSVRIALRGSVGESRQALVDQLAGFKALGLRHAVLDFRRDSVGEMLEILDFLARDVRPAIDRA